MAIDTFEVTKWKSLNFPQYGPVHFTIQALSSYQATGFILKYYVLSVCYVKSKAAFMAVNIQHT